MRCLLDGSKVLWRLSSELAPVLSSCSGCACKRFFTARYRHVEKQPSEHSRRSLTHNRRRARNSIKLSQDDFQGLFGSMRIGARTEILLDLDINPILVRVYKDESLPMELVFGDHDAPPFRGEIAFDAVFTLKVNEAAFLVQIGAQLAGQSLSIGELEPATELAFELAIKRGLLVLEPSCPACGPEHSPLALTDFTNTYLTALIVLVPDIFEYMEPRVIEAAAENWHDALRMLMRPLRARQVWPMFEDATTTELVTSFLSMVGSEGYFTRDLPLSHIDALRHYSFEWALWRNRLGLSQAGKRIAFPCASCGALGQCAPTCTAAPALRNGFRRAAAVAAAGPGGSAPVVVEIRVVAPGE